MATGGDDTVTISDLEEYYHLPQGCLDKPCTTEHAREIAHELDSWEIVAARLNLTKQQIEAIKRDNHSEEEKKLATMIKWQERFSFKATYRKLAETFLAIDRADLASKLYRIIPPQSTTPLSPLPAPLTPNLTAQQDHLSVDQSPSPSPSSPQTSLEPTSPQSSSGISVGSPPQLQLTVSNLQPISVTQKIETIETTFLNMVENVRDLFIQGGTSLDTLQHIASDLKIDLKGELGLLFKNELSRINGAKTIGELFAILSYFWDYLQPDLLVYIVERCENNNAKIVVNEYKQHLCTFRQQVTLQEYIGKRQCNLDDDDRKQISVRLGEEWHQKTLDDLENVRIHFADEFSLLRLVPKLHGLKSNSITVIFSLPKSVVLNHDQLLKFFQSYNPLKVMVDGVSIYDVEAQEFHQPASSDTKTQVTEGEETTQGEKQDCAAGSRDVLIIVSSESLQGPDIVPRHDVELTKEDMEKLQRLNLPPEQWKDDASIIKARYEIDGRYTVVGVERSTPEDGLTREYVLKRIERLMTSTRKQGVTLRYYGPGKRNTGDWCFEDGYTTFRDLAQLYSKLFKGHVLTIHTDCSFSGSWVKELMKFLDEQEVRPCGHSAKEKGILIKVYASCQPTEIPCRLLYSVRANSNDKNTGHLSVYEEEITEDQHPYGPDPTELRCKASSFEEPCTFSPEYTWERKESAHRVYLVRGEDRGRPRWHYVLLPDDKANIKEFLERIKNDVTVNVADHGQVLKSGWGGDPPNEVKDYFSKTYRGN